MKFEVFRDVKGEPCIGGTKMETLKCAVMSFVPMSEGLDGRPLRTDDGSIFMAIVGSYQEVLKPKEVCTIEVASLEELVALAIGNSGRLVDEIHLTPSRCVECVGLLDVEEPPSVASSYS